MGGTFGCVGEPLAPMPFDLFRPLLLKVIAADFLVDCFAAPIIKDSSACTAPDWLALVQQIQNLQQQGYAHFVIIHGTDTMSYAAATLARFLGQSCHVIITGSQYPLLEPDATQIRTQTDALDNLHLALKQVTQLPKGTYLAFHHQVFHAQTALKIHTTELNAFSGVLAEQPCTVAQSAHMVTAHDLQKSQSLSVVSLMAQPIALSAFKQQLNNLLKFPPHFLIIQGFGIGNLAVDSDIIALFHQFKVQGCLVVLHTQVSSGQLDQRYAISKWVSSAKLLTNNTHGHADLYAKVLKLYLQFDSVEQRYHHWTLS